MVIRKSVLVWHEQLIRGNTDAPVRVLSHHTEVECIPVHEAFVVLVGVREVL